MQKNNQKTTNSKRIIELLQSYCSTVLSDIFKLEKYDIVKSPFGKGRWLINIEAVHSEKKGVMCIFSFELTTKDITDILDKGKVGQTIRSGRMEYDR